MITVKLIPLDKMFYGVSSCESKMVQLSQIDFIQEDYSMYFNLEGGHSKIDVLRHVATTELAKTLINDLMYVEFFEDKVVFRLGVLVEREKRSLKRDIKTLRAKNSVLSEDNVAIKRKMYNLLSINEDLENEVHLLRNITVAQLILSRLRSFWRNLTRRRNELPI